MPHFSIWLLLCIKIPSGKNWDSVSITYNKDKCPGFSYVSWAFCAATLGIAVPHLHPHVTVLKGMLRIHPNILLAAAYSLDLLLLIPSSTPIC